jgi:DNA-binding Lrp family transcriptional regulator
VKSTPQSVKARLEKLEKKGVIIQYRIGIDLNKLGLELYKAILTLDRYDSGDEKKFLSYVSNLPNTHYLIRNIWNIELEFVVSNYQEYYQIIENLKKEFPHMIRTVDSVLMITDEWTPGFKNLLKLPKGMG